MAMEGNAPIVEPLTWIAAPELVEAPSPHGLAAVADAGRPDLLGALLVLGGVVAGLCAGTLALAFALVA